MQRMGQLEGKWIAGALIPAIIITILFFFGALCWLCQLEFDVAPPEFASLRLTAITVSCALTQPA